MKRTLLLISLFVLAAFAAPAQAVQVYGTNYGGVDEIVGYNHTSGPATALPGSGWDVGSGSGGLYSMAFSRDGARGVSGWGFSGNALIGFRAAADGAVMAGTPKVSGPGGYRTAASPVLDVVYGINTSTGMAAANQAADGGLTALPGSPFVTAQEIGDFAITPNGRFMYATGAWDDGIVHRFALAANGAVSYLGSVFVTGAEELQITPDGRFLIATGGGVSPTDKVSSLAIGADGTLNLVGTPYSVDDSSSGPAAIDKDSSLAVIPNSNNDKLISLKIGSDGALTFAGETAFDDASSAVFSADGNLYIMRTGSEPGIYFATRTPGASTFATPTQIAPVNWYQDARILLRPTPGGVAQFKSTIQSKPLTYRLDGSTSTGTARYEWDLGADGKRSSASPATDVTFSKPGTYQVTLTAVDSSGCGGALFYTGQSATCSDSAAARKTLTIDTPPWIKSLKISPSSAGSKTKIKFVLTEKASVSFYAQKPVKGRTVGTTCKKQTAKNETGKKCTLWVRASKTFRASGKAGKTNSLRFTGKVGKAKLAKGTYRLYAVATDSARGKGPAKTASFKIKK